MSAEKVAIQRKKHCKLIKKEEWFYNKKNCNKNQEDKEIMENENLLNLWKRIKLIHNYV